MLCLLKPHFAEVRFCWNCHSLGARKLTLKNIARRLKNNAQGFLRAHRFTLALLLFALICDAASTTYFMVRLGVSAELHPAIRLLSHFVGPYLGPFFTVIIKFSLAVVIGIYWRRFAEVLFWAISLISMVAAIYNIMNTQYSAYNLGP